MHTKVDRIKKEGYLEDKGDNIFESVSSVGLITIKQFNLSVHFSYVSQRSQHITHPHGKLQAWNKRV